jgi:glycerate dehydrogenase
VVTLHCPLTNETHHLVDERRLGTMKHSALLVNTARGALVDELALRRALDEGAIAGAALDVVESEPMRPDNPLLGAKNSIITPHIAWASLEARRRLMTVTAENVRAFLRGEPINVVS